MWHRRKQENQERINTLNSYVMQRPLWPAIGLNFPCVVLAALVPSLEKK
jgi:hypothetical protein